MSPAVPDQESLAAGNELRGQQRGFRPESVIPGALTGALTLAPRLDNLALADSYVKLIEPALTTIGATYRTEKLESITGGERSTFHFTLVLKIRKHALLAISDEILTVPNRGNRLALNEMRDLFAREYSTLFIFHEQAPNPVYKTIMQGEWQDNFKVKVVFIALADLRAFATMAIEEQVNYLTLVLDLGKAAAVIAAPVEKPRASEKMTITEIRSLSKKLGQIDDFADVRGRRVILKNAGLDAVTESIDLQGPPNTIAADLVNAVLDAGLGKLLAYLKSRPDLPPDDIAFIARLLDSYSFD